MDEYFTVPAGKEPTLFEVVDAMDEFYQRQHALFPTMYPQDPIVKSAWVKDMFPTFNANMRAKVGEPLDTATYDRELPHYGTPIPVDHWLECVEAGGFNDYDGNGNPARAQRIEWKDGMDPDKYPTIEIMVSDMNVIPSLRHLVPKDATHIVWYNR